MRCRCGYRFCFDPKADALADGKFVAAIHLASANGKHHYTVKQLHAALCRLMSGDAPLAAALTIGAAVITIALVWFGFTAMAVFPGVAALVCGLAWLSARLGRREAMRLDIKGLVSRWQQAGKPLDNMIERPGLHEPPPNWPEDDIYDYGVERLMIVDRDELVDLFVLNGLHTSERALILAESGYPRYLQIQAGRALRDNPNVPVFLLHGADPRGRHMKGRIRDLAWLPVNRHPVIDLGFGPDDVNELHQLRLMQQRPNDVNISADSLLYSDLARMLPYAFIHHSPLASTPDGGSSGNGDGYSDGDSDYG